MIPVTVALLIWSRWPIVSNPILYIFLGGIGGYIWFTRRHRRMRRAMMENHRKEVEEHSPGLGMDIGAGVY